MSTARLFCVIMWPDMQTIQWKVCICNTADRILLFAMKGTKLRKVHLHEQMASDCNQIQLECWLQTILAVDTTLNPVAMEHVKKGAIKRTAIAM